MTDNDLLERLRRGDGDAFSALFREHYTSLIGLATRMLRQPETAEEIVQDVFLEIWRRREHLVVEESIRAYLFRSTRNRALNHLRHEKVVRRTSDFVRGDQEPPRTAVVDLMESEIDDAVRDALETLPPRCREIFELSRGHGLRYAEIAAALEISVKTVESQMGKALRLLRERLAIWLVDN